MCFARITELERVVLTAPVADMDGAEIWWSGRIDPEESTHSLACLLIRVSTVIDAHLDTLCCVHVVLLCVCVQ